MVVANMSARAIAENQRRTVCHNGHTHKVGHSLGYYVEMFHGSYSGEVRSPYDNAKLKLDLTPFQDMDLDTTYIELHWTFANPTRIASGAPVHSGSRSARP